MHLAKADAQGRRPSLNLLRDCSQASRLFVQVGELLSLVIADSVDCGLAGFDADLVRAEGCGWDLTCFRFGVAARGLSASSPPDMDLSCLPMIPPVLPAWASAEDTFANAKCDRASKANPIDPRRLMLPSRLRGGHGTGQIGVLEEPR